MPSLMPRRPITLGGILLLLMAVVAVLKVFIIPSLSWTLTFAPLALWFGWFTYQVFSRSRN